MKHGLKEYSNELKKLSEENISISDKELKYHYIKIKNYQHERLIHLLVTITFALLTFFSLYFLVTVPSIAIGILFIIFLIMLAFYIKHYYFLENNVQKLYKIYDDLTKTKH